MDDGVFRALRGPLFSSKLNQMPRASTSPAPHLVFIVLISQSASLVRSEWPLGKTSMFAGAACPAAAAVGDLDKALARSVEQEIGLGAPLDRVGFGAMRPPADLVPRQIPQQIVP